jgi:energy-coupling factor transporter ATP-binding protein EcfA2
MSDIADYYAESADMPNVVKNKEVNRMTVDFMSMLTTSEEAGQNEGTSVLLYGPSGSGKTTWLNVDDLKILYLAPDDGRAVLPKKPNIFIPKQGVKKWEDVLYWLQALESSPQARAQFDVVALDGLTNLQKFSRKFAIQTTPQVKRQAADVPSQADWGHLLIIFKDVIDRFVALTKDPSNLKPLHFIMIGHSEVEKDELTGVYSHMLNLSGRDTPQVLCAAVDVVAYQGTIFKYRKDQLDSDGKPKQGEAPELHYVTWLKDSMYENKRFFAKIRVPKEYAGSVQTVHKDFNISKLVKLMADIRKPQPATEEVTAQ